MAAIVQSITSAAFAHSDSVYPPAGKQPNDDYDQDDDQQKVNQSAADVKGERTQQPADEEYDCDNPE
jgi:hypothetical protein